MYPRYTFAASILALLAAFPTIAADKENETVVVTATRQAMRSSELLSDVSVITREEIEQSGQNTVEQLLIRQPGIEYSGNGGPGTTSSIYVRGANANHTLVLIDGQRSGSVSTGTMAFSRIPLNQVERIEILRGPASSLYGADAIGGVIQIFTRRGEGPAHFNASASFGTNNTTELNAGVSGGTDVVSYSLQAAYFGTDGFNAISNPANGAFNADRDGYHNNNASGSLAFRPAQGHEFGFNFLHSNGTNKYDSTPKANDFANDEVVSNYSVYSRNRLAPAWTSTLLAGRSTDDSTNRTNGIATSVFRTDQDQISWQNDLKLPVGRALLATEYLKQKLTSSSVFTLNERIIRSLLAGWNGSLDDHRLQFNMRRDDNSQFGGKTTGFVGYGYQFTTDWRAHASYGTAFKVPTFNDLYFPLSCFPPFGCFGGNPDLKPELAKNTEAGIDWEHGDQHLSAVFFSNKVTDLIDSTLSVPLNVNKATLSGTSLGYTGSFGAWSGGINVDLQRARDDVTGKRLARRADEQLKTHLAYSTGALRLGGEWQLVGKRFDDRANTKRLGGYGLLNLFADYRLEKNWSFFARANNVLNKKYELARDFGTGGASVFVGIRYGQQ